MMQYDYEFSTRIGYVCGVKKEYTYVYAQLDEI